ncbi:hypothetical protein C5167_045284 [Papaver somniferum]|uniref:Uncharacterized protein n=1 Tax=Papaver somniferum TaxID=3469 RepID=A0A4Y7LAE3_PAPSO|nr:hypothetical protein C5167_045284 [Papaver somniferum]
MPKVLCNFVKKACCSTDEDATLIEITLVGE